MHLLTYTQSFTHTLTDKHRAVTLQHTDGVMFRVSDTAENCGTHKAVIYIKQMQEVVLLLCFALLCFLMFCVYFRAGILYGN